jgi:hypothetical protein
MTHCSIVQFFLHLICLLTLPCAVENALSGDLFWSSADLNLMEDSGVHHIRSDERGIWTVDGLSLDISDRAKLSVMVADSIAKTFGEFHLARTLENGTDIHFEGRADSKNTWLTHFTASSSKQEIDRLSWTDQVNRYRNRAYSLSEGWRHQLSKGLTAEVFAGISQCNDVDQGKRAYLPFGGARLLKKFSWGEVSAVLYRGALGGGSLTSIYGTQQVKQFDLSGHVPLDNRISFNWNCGVAIANRMFGAKDVLQEAPLVSAGASIHYRIISKLWATVGYAHRKLMTKKVERNGAIGPIATASLTYNLF